MYVFDLESRREYLEVIYELSGFCWVQLGRDCVGIIRDSYVELFVFLLQRQMCFGCFSIYVFVFGEVGSEALEKRGKEEDGIFLL